MNTTEYGEKKTNGSEKDENSFDLWQLTDTNVNKQQMYASQHWRRDKGMLF